MSPVCTIKKTLTLFWQLPASLNDDMNQQQRRGGMRLSVLHLQPLRSPKSSRCPADPVSRWRGSRWPAGCRNARVHSERRGTMLRRVLATALAGRRQVTPGFSISSPPLSIMPTKPVLLIRNRLFFAVPHPVFKKRGIHPDGCYSSCIKVFVLRLSRRMKLLLLTYSRRHSVPLADVVNRLRDTDEVVAWKAKAATSDQHAMDLFVYRFAEPDLPWLNNLNREEFAQFLETRNQERLETLANPHKRRVNFLRDQRDGAADRVMATPPGELTFAWLDAMLEYAESSVLLEHLLRGIGNGCKVDADVVAFLTPMGLRTQIWEYYFSEVPQSMVRELFEGLFPDEFTCPERYVDQEVESPVFIDTDGRKQQAAYSPGSCLRLDPSLAPWYESRMVDSDGEELRDVITVLEVLGNYHPKEGSLPWVFQLAHGFLTDAFDALHLKWKEKQKQKQKQKQKLARTA